MSIATKRGDGGQTGLSGGVRVSKADLRVEAYGTVDELNAALGFARSICTNAEISSWTQEIQKTLFRVASALATPPESRKAAPSLTADDVDQLTERVHSIEAKDGILSDWSLPGAHTEAAAQGVDISDATALAFAQRVAKTPRNILEIRKAAITRASMGLSFREALLAGVEWDVIAHGDPGVMQMKRLVRENGMKAVS